MNFIKKLIVMAIVMLTCSLTAYANPLPCDLEPPKHTIGCHTLTTQTGVKQTCCFTHYESDQGMCTDLWCTMHDQCSWETHGPPECG